MAPRGRYRPKARVDRTEGLPLSGPSPTMDNWSDGSREPTRLLPLVRKLKAGTNRDMAKIVSRGGLSKSTLRALIILWMAPIALADRGEPLAINEARYVRIGGIDQWLQISGADRSNPVLLWLNGGPGGSTVSSICLYRAWERVFTIVMWDQRGEGKTFEKSGASVGPSMTIDKMTSDGIEVAQFLRRHLHKDKIILLGHSWGSILGMHMLVKQPELFSVFVGTGQVINLYQQEEAGYPQLLKRAEAEGNLEAAKDLSNIGPPPWTDNRAYTVDNRWAGALDPPSKVSPDICASERAKPEPAYEQAGAQFSGRMLFGAIVKQDINEFAKRLAVPLVLIQGRDDLLTTTSVVKEYFEEVSAPHKDFVELPGAGHFAIFRDPDAFLAQLLAKVRPVAEQREH